MEVCEKCKRLAVLDSLSVTACLNCCDQVVTGHAPAYKYCDKCAAAANVCKQCGESLSV